MFIESNLRGEENPPEVDQTRPELEGVLMDGTVMHMRYKFPDITCDHCILMLRYRECSFVPFRSAVTGGTAHLASLPSCLDLRFY